MARHVRTTIRYDGPALAGHEMDVQDLAPALLALGDIIQIANKRFNGDTASIRVLVNADVEQKCFQIDLSLVQSVLKQAQGLFADQDVKTALDIARAVGIVGSAGAAVAGLFKLIKWLSRNRKDGETRFETKSEGGVTIIVNGDGNTITVSDETFQLATDPAVVERAKRVVKPLQNRGYETLSFVDQDEAVETITALEARDILDAPTNLIESEREDVSEIRGPIRIKSPQYEGNAKWTVLWGGKAIEVAMPPEWVKAFQSNEVAAPPNTILDVVMEQYVAIDEKGMAVGSPTYIVREVLDITLPAKAMPQTDWLEGDLED